LFLRYQIKPAVEPTTNTVPTATGIIIVKLGLLLVGLVETDDKEKPVIALEEELLTELAVTGREEVAARIEEAEERAELMTVTGREEVAARIELIVVIGTDFIVIVGKGLLVTEPGKGADHCNKQTSPILVE
jgi:hypothetical protein